MAKKDNFDFETESKFKLDVSSLKNLTAQQKGIIIGAIVAVVLVIAIVIACVSIVNSGLFGDNNKNNNMTPEDQTVTEVPETLRIFQIATPPMKTSYYVGDSPNYYGMFVYFRDGDGKSNYLYYQDDPDAFTITGFDSSEPAAEQVITVECRGYTDTFTVEILPVPETDATLVGISMKELPRTKYYLGEAFNPANGIILAEYSDGTTVEVELDISNVSGYSYITTPGEYTLTIKYFDDKGGYAETTMTVTMLGWD